MRLQKKERKCTEKKIKIIMVNLKAQMQQSITALSLKEAKSILSSVPQK